MSGLPKKTRESKFNKNFGRRTLMKNLPTKMNNMKRGVMIPICCCS